jgi:hypothetical protein
MHMFTISIADFVSALLQELPLVKLMTVNKALLGDSLDYLRFISPSK